MNQHKDSNPGYTHTILDSLPNAWDRCGVMGKAITVIALVLACCFAAGVVVGFAS